MSQKADGVLNVPMYDLWVYANARYDGNNVIISTIFDDLEDTAYTLGLHKEFIVRHYTYMYKKYKMSWKDYLDSFSTCRAN